MSYDRTQTTRSRTPALAGALPPYANDLRAGDPPTCGVFGFLHPAATKTFTALKQQLEDTIVDPRDWPAPDDGIPSNGKEDTTHRPDHPGLCPQCGGALRYVGRIVRRRPGMLPLVYQRGPPTRKERESS